jgi:hypothetical protein
MFKNAAFSGVRMSRRGQAAMEFLMTYGWALLVVLIVISALAYFGVLSPGNLVSERCSFEIGIGCKDFAVGSNGVSVVVENMRGTGMTITTVAFASDALVGDCDATVNAFLAQGERATLYADDVSCAGVDTGRDKNTYDVSLSYTLPGSTLEHTATGESIAPQQGSISFEGGGYGGGDDSLLMQLLLDDPEDIGADSSGSGNEGSFSGETFHDSTSNGASLIAGQYGNGLSFSEDLVTFNHHNDLDLSSEFAVSLWIRPQSTNNEYVLHKRYGAWTAGNYFLRLDVDEVQAGYKRSNGQSWAQVNGPIATGVWSHILWTRKSSTNYLYINGQLVSSPAEGINPDAAQNELLTFGASFPTTGALRYYAGELDEVRIYHKGFDQQDVTADMTSPYPLAGVTASYSMESLDANTVSDTHIAVSGHRGSSVMFDGSNDQMTASAGSMKLTEGTLAFWFYPYQTSAQEFYFQNKADSNENMQLYVLSNALIFSVEKDNVPYGVTAGGITAGQWRHAAMTWKGDSIGNDDELSIYVDGILRDFDNTGNLFETKAGTNYFGSSAAGTVNANIILDELQLWDRALSAAEVAVLASS